MSSREWEDGEEKKKSNHLRKELSQHHWLTPVIPGTQEAEIRRIAV
jgi:hypothetical protein